jgi:hypothetical protein
VVLIEAQIVSIERVHASETHTTPSLELGGDVTVSVRATDILIGRIEDESFLITLPVTSIPAPGELRYIFILATRTNDGIQPVRWDYVESGFCVDQATARSLDIEREILSLNREGRLGCETERVTWWIQPVAATDSALPWPA